MPPILICDKEVARLIGMSPSWVRVQRWKRRKKEDHVFTIDPILIGSSPRYKAEDINAWIASLEKAGCDEQPNPE
jgi:predicted DNA-binding transcriptional regulator AlpA